MLTELIKIRSREGFIDRCNLVVAHLQTMQLAIDEGVEGLGLRERPYAQTYLRQVSEMLSVICTAVSNGAYHQTKGGER